ncbi:MAG: substrate-binding domain-containing protein [Ruminococcus sp.]
MPRLKDFIAANPQIRITISCQSTYQTLKLLEEDKIDIGLIGRPQKLSGYEFLPLLQIQDTFVATHQYLENQHQLFPSEPLQHTATFMLLDEQNITRQSVNTMLHEHQMQLGHILEVSSMDLLIQFAQVGLGIACVIKEFVQNDLDKEILVEAPLGLTFPSREIGFVCKKGSENQKLLTQLAEI